jgi:putative zinc finger/helix-turn-helix YgiT family protein
MTDTCPFCDAPVQVRLVRGTIPYTTPHGTVVLNAEVPYEICAACGHEGFGETGERVRTEVVYRYLGRLAPREIVAIRENLNLTQAAFADLLGVGRASLERWERGGVMQNQSMDNLIRLMSEPAHREWLERQRSERHETVAN